MLLDDLVPGWRRQLRSTSDLGDLLASATSKPPTTNLALAAARYDGAALRKAEETRDRAQQVRVAELRRLFIDGPVLTMPAGGSGTSNTTGSVGIPWGRYRVFSQFHPFRWMGSSERQRRCLALCRWDHTVRTGYPAARRHYP